MSNPKMTVTRKVNQHCKNCAKVTEGFEGFMPINGTFHKVFFCVNCERVAHDPRPLLAN